MEEDWCYICMENENQEYKFLQNGICQCKNMKIHNKCFFLLKEKYKCSVCKSVYENFTVKQDNKLLIFRKYGITEQYYVNQSDRKEGLYILKLYDSRILLHCFYKDGVRNGLYQEFYQNTQIKNFGYYIEGRKHGIHLCWYPDNKLKYSCEYFYGIPNGIHNWYSIEEIPIIESTFDKGKLNGLFTLYHPNGNFWIKSNFKSDLQDGIFKEYNQEGLLVNDLIFKDDKFISLGSYFSTINNLIKYQDFIRLFFFFFFIYIF
jgi:antitoxin component YwqK of YwqJK toxin-antitoxin module